MRKLLLITPILFVFSSCKIIRAIKDNKRSNETILPASFTDSFTLPFELENNKIVFRVKIMHDGKEDLAVLMMDTGAPTLLSEDYARKHHVTFSDSSSMNLSTPVADTKSVKKYAAKDVTISISGINILKPHMRILTISKVVTECSHIDGILGVDILSQFNLVFDFKERNVTFYNKKTLPGDLGKYTHVLKFSNFSPFQKTPEVSLTVNGTTEDYIWDTGFNGALYMRNNSEKSFNKWLKAHPEAKRYQNYGAAADISGRSAATTTSYVFLTDSILQKNDLLSVSRLKASNQLNTNIKLARNNVGIGLMKNYRMLISWTNKKIYLQETVKPAAAPSITKMLAGYEQESKSVIIRLIAEDSKAFANGIRANDKVIAIDDKAVDELLQNADRCAIDNKISNLMAKAKQINVMHGGKMQTVVIE